MFDGNTAPSTTIQCCRHERVPNGRGRRLVGANIMRLSPFQSILCGARQMLSRRSAPIILQLVIIMCHVPHSLWITFGLCTNSCQLIVLALLLPFFFFLHTHTRTHVTNRPAFSEFLHTVHIMWCTKEDYYISCPWFIFLRFVSRVRALGSALQPAPRFFGFCFFLARDYRGGGEIK